MLVPLLDDQARVREPLVVVDLDADVSAQIDVFAGDGRVVVGTTERGRDDPRVDVVLAASAGECAAPDGVRVPDPVAEAHRLQEAAQAAPQATVVLAALLRATEDLPVDAALEMESLAYSTLLGGPEFARWLAARGARPRSRPAAGPPVRVRREHGVLHVTLQRPQRRNAFGREVRDALVEGLRAAWWDPEAPDVLLDGAGPVFCAGGDLDEFGTAPDPVTAHLVRVHAGAGRLLHRLAGRTTVRVQGACVGAGIELAAFAGRIEATADATFRLPEVGMGLLPGAGGTVSIPRRIGRRRTLYLALSGQALDAGVAAQWRLIDVVGPTPPAARPRAEGVSTTG